MVDVPALTATQVRDLVELACRAPSVHNTQPWRWCTDGQFLNLYADRSRQLESTDPDGRDLLLSCGAALHHLAVASAALGWRARIRRMPNPADDDHLAAVSFQQYDAEPEDLEALEALKRRRTDRRLPSTWPVPVERLEGMVELAARAGVLALPITSQRSRTRLIDLTLKAAQVQDADDSYLRELSGWIGHSTEDGVPWTSLPVLSDSPDVGDEHPFPLTRFPAGSLLESEEENKEDLGAALLVLATSSDDRTSQLRAGEALSAVLIRGTGSGLAMVPLTQSLEVPETREALHEELLRDVGYPQAVIHIGWAPISEEDDGLPFTPRRPVDKVLGECSG